MKVRSVLLAALLLFSSLSIADEIEEAKDFSYKQAKDLAICSGDFLFAESVAKGLMNQPALAKMYKERSNGYKVAAVWFFFMSGMANDFAWAAAEGESETTLTYWWAKMESVEPDDSDGLQATIEELGFRVESCLMFGEIAEMAIQQFRTNIK